MTVIEPRRTWAAFSPRDLWAHRELLYFLTWRDLKVRYKQTVFGVAWVVIQPLLTMLIFTLVFTKFARVNMGDSYPVFIFCGLLPWTFFSAAVNTGGLSLVGNANLVTKVFFPRTIVPLASVASRLVDFACSFAILLVLMAYYRVGPTRNLLLLPALVVLMALLTTGFCLLLSALNVKYRDIGVAIPVLLQLWMFVSPVIYPSSFVPEKWRALYALNPLVGLIDGFRSALLGVELNRGALAVSAAFTLAVLACSAFVFRRLERSFADVI